MARCWRWFARSSAPGAGGRHARSACQCERGDGRGRRSIVGYRTNPHVDQRARVEEAAQALRLILAGEADPRTAFIRLPLAPPSVTLLTAEAPYGTLIDLGQRRLAEAGGS
jgi:hypothetical protein